jgi:hypothetical protein
MVMIDLGHEKESLRVISVTRVTGMSLTGQLHGAAFSRLAAPNRR